MEKSIFTSNTQMKENSHLRRFYLIADDAKMMAIFREAEEKRAKWALGLR